MSALALMAGLALVAVPAASASPTPTPSTTTPPPSTATPSRPVFGVDTSDTSISKFRHRGVTIFGDRIPADEVDLLLDGEVVRSIPTPNGGFFITQTFGGITEGEHVIAVAQNGDVIAQQNVEVTADGLDLTVAPRWITSNKLATDGVTLSAEDLEPGLDMIARVGEASRRGEVTDDGGVAITVTLDGQLDGPITVSLEADRAPNLYSYDTVRVTTLTAEAADGGTTIVGGGFEPDSTVTLRVDGRSATTTASASGTARFPSPVVGRHEVVLSSDAGEVRATLDLTANTIPPALTRELEQIRTTTDQMNELRSAARTTAVELAKIDRPGIMSSALSTSVLEQVKVSQQIASAAPTASPLPGKQGFRGTAGSQLTGIGPIVGQNEASRTDAAVAGAQAKQKEAEALAAGAAEQYGLASEQAKIVQQQLDEMIRAIVDFLKEMKDAEVEAIRSIARGSTLYLTHRAVSLDSSFAVEVPEGFSGRHHIGSIAPSSGVVLAWVPLDVTAAPAAEDSLPNAGGASPWWPVAGLAILAVGVALLVRQGRTRGSTSRSHCA